MERKVLLSLILMAVTIAIFRIIPRFDNVWGITPMFSIALFSGCIFRKNKLWAFLLPLFALFFSDILWQIIKGTGFYDGQWFNYLLFVAITCIGFLLRKVNILNVIAVSLAAPTAYFLLSNFYVWFSGGGFARPKNFSGLLQTYIDGLPFYYPWQLISTLVFSAFLFGAWQRIHTPVHSKASIQ